MNILNISEILYMTIFENKWQKVEYRFKGQQCSNIGIKDGLHCPTTF